MNLRLSSMRACLTLLVLAGASVPATAKACSVSPDVVDEVRVVRGLHSCLSVDETWDPGDYEHPTLLIENDCEDAVEVRINDCVPCYDDYDCFDCGQEWVELGANSRRELVFQLYFPVGDHLGETVETSIDWVHGEESGELELELDMPQKHPDQQANEACPGLCSVSASGGPGVLGLLVLLGPWARRRRS